jgi:hypothetical protein
MRLTRLRHHRNPSFTSGNLKIGRGNPNVVIAGLYSHASIKAAHSIAQSAETNHLTITEMLAGEFEDYRMYEYKGLVFFPAYNQLWNLAKNGRFCRIVVQNPEGKPRWGANSRLYVAGG